MKLNICLILSLATSILSAKPLKDHRGRTFQEPSTPPKVISGFIGADEILVELYREHPQRILALSPLSRDERYSAISNKAKRWKNTFGNELESLILLKPDLVIVARYSRPEWINILDKANIKTFVLGKFSSIEDIRFNILTLGRLTNHQDIASQLIIRMNHHIADLQKKCSNKKLSLMNFSANNTIFGSKTSFDSILRTLGLSNAANKLGIEGWLRVSTESLLILNPDIIITSSFKDRQSAYSQLSQRTGWKHLEAVKKKRFITVRSATLSSVSHHVTSAMEEICNQL